MTMKTNTLMLTSAAVVVFVLIACSPSPPHAITNVIITMERGICYGPCPVYEVTISGNGTVIFDGKKNVREGVFVYAVPQEDVQRLVEAFYDLDFFSLNHEYTKKCTVLGCSTASDLPTTTTMFTINGKTKKVINYYGAPDRLAQLEDLIDETARTKEYTTP
jgi:hypothetical protein